MTEIGRRLRNERIRLRHTQNKMGDVGGVRANTQAKYESGERSPTAKYLARVAAKGTDVLYVLTGQRSTGPNVEAEPDEYRLLLNFSCLPPHEKELISELLKSLAGVSKQVATATYSP